MSDQGDRQLREDMHRWRPCAEDAAAQARIVRSIRGRVYETGKRPATLLRLVGLGVGLLLLAVVAAGNLLLLVHHPVGALKPGSSRSPAASVAPTPGTIASAPRTTAPVGPLPPGRTEGAAAYDLRHHQLVLFGGQQGQLSFSDTWTWDGAHWREQAPAHRPPPSSRIAMAYDGHTHTVLLFGPGGGQTWTWDGTDWTQHFPGASPPFNSSSPGSGELAYDPTIQKVVFVGGPNNPGTWAWDGVNWQNLHPAHTPPGYFGEQMLAYSPAQHGLVVVAQGTDGSLRVWRYDGSDWTAIETVQQVLTGLFGASFARDEDLEEWVMIGVGGGAVAPSTTLVGRAGSWSTVDSVMKPARGGAQFAYDADGKRVLVFGGLGDGRYLGDLWSWDGTKWTRLAG